jgi:hypothetical protein
MASRDLALIVAIAFAASACGSTATMRRFRLLPPLWEDTDLRSVSVQCHKEPTEKEPDHVSCSPEVYVSPLAWDGIDNSIFRPLADSLALEPEREALNVNSMDEVPDSAWFTNRIGKRPMSLEEVGLGACTPAQKLEGETAKDEEWLIDAGKPNGSSPGFRIRLKDKGKYMLKSDGPNPERPTAASIIGAAIYHAVGFYTSCEQVVYVKPSALKLTPGLKVTDNTGVAKTFDQEALQGVLKGATPRGELNRFQASAWLPGHLLGPFKYEKLREDDPNDIIPHQHRRELRGGRMLAAWLDHFDAREQNSMDSWIADDPKGPNDASPGFVRHYYLDTSDCFGSEWDWDGISRRLGYSYLLDWGAIGLDFVTLGLLDRRWDSAKKEPGKELFGYFNGKDFVPEQWVNEYPNPSFSRMTERDAAWMTRILAHFTPPMVHVLVKMGRFTNEEHATYLEDQLNLRLHKILERYLLRLSPLANVEMEQNVRLCAKDLARERELRPSDAFHYEAELSADDVAPVSAKISMRSSSEPCVELQDIEPPSHSLFRYATVRVTNGVSKGPLIAHLYYLGPGFGYRLVGLERPER